MKWEVENSHGGLTSGRVEYTVPLFRSQFALGPVQIFILLMFCLLQNFISWFSKRCQSWFKCLLACFSVHPLILVLFVNFRDTMLFWSLLWRQFDGKADPFYCLNFKFASPLLFSKCNKMISPRHILQLSICYLLSISPKLPHLSPREKMHRPEIARAKSSFSDTFLDLLNPTRSLRYVDNFDFPDVSSFQKWEANFSRREPRSSRYYSVPTIL